jgi:amidohydrolase
VSTLRHHQASEALAEAMRVMDDLLPAAITLRQSLHADPEVGGTEDRTVQKLLGYLAPVAVTRVSEGFFCSTGERGPALGVRAELDALAVQESSRYPFPSQVPGVGHLCGHDVHMAALALVTRVLRSVDLGCRLVAVFQPREEVTPSGAVDMLAASDFRQLGISAMIGLHLQPILGDGSFSATPGPVNASCDEFSIRVIGRPSHGAYPHQSRDPIVAASQLVCGLQTLVAREIDPMQPSVVSVGRIHGGDAVNAIPGEVELGGTVRSYSADSRSRLHDGLRRVARGIALAADVDIEVTIERGEPVLVNDADVAATVTSALVSAGLTERPALRSCGSDDFAYYCELVPSTMVFVGTGAGGLSSPGLHHPAFAPADAMVRKLAEISLVSLAALAKT